MSAPRSLLVDGVAVDVAERDPGRLLEPLEDDDPAREIAVGLLPEGLLRPPVELVEKRRDGVGEAGRIQPRRVERVPRVALPLEVELHVVAAAAAAFEHRADVRAEVALDLEAETGGAALLVPRAPAQKLLGERPHARTGLARPDRPEDDRPGVEGLVPHHQPLRVANLAPLVGVVHLADDDARLRVVRGQRPRRKTRVALAPRPQPLEPHAPDRLRDEPEHEHQDPRREGRPQGERPVPERRLLADEDQETVVERKRMQPHPPHRHRAGRREPRYHVSGNPSACQTSASATPGASSKRRSARRPATARCRAATLSAPP